MVHQDKSFERFSKTFNLKIQKWLIIEDIWKDYIKIVKLNYSVSFDFIGLVHMLKTDTMRCQSYFQNGPSLHIRYSRLPYIHILLIIGLIDIKLWNILTICSGSVRCALSFAEHSQWCAFTVLKSCKQLSRLKCSWNHGIIIKWRIIICGSMIGCILYNTVLA